LILRGYQARAVDDLRAQFAAGFTAPICQAPTGAGKTVIASEIVRLCIEKQGTAMFLVPRIELLNQAVEKLISCGISSIRTIQAQNDNGPRDSRVIVASIPTLTSERWLADLPAVDLCLMDECHHGKARTYAELLAALRAKNPRLRTVGLTATPQRGDGRALDNFDCIVTVASVRELIEQGALVPATVFAPPRIMSTRELAQSPVDAYTKRTPGQKAIVFCSTVAHARATADEFNSSGNPSHWLSGESKDRDAIISAFARDEFRVLVNVNCLIEGFDDPSISTAILARRFTHVGTYLQACGRVLRPHPSKQRATIIDLSGSALVHGTPDLDRQYTLTGKGIDDHRASLRQCQQCGAVFQQAPVCPYCEFATPPLTRQQAKALGLELHQVDPEKQKPTSWPMRAKRRGFCSRCTQPVEKGTWIVYSARSKQAMHASCAARQERSAA
jgi:DNA repair protein RadD